MNSAWRLSSELEIESRPAPRLLSLVIPLYNEEAVIPHLRKRLSEFLPCLPCPTELVLVNDGSHDGTLKLLQGWAACDPQVRLLSLSRNFGHQAASTAGMDYVRGDATVLMDADLQDPPEVILQMIAEYRRGFDVVYAQRESRTGESAAKRGTAWLYYRLLRLSGCRELPPDTGDFRLISASCLHALQSMRETHRFIRGMVAWVGFPQTAVRFKRPSRVAGKTKYGLGRMLWLGWTGALSFSPTPLRVVFGLGIIAAAAATGIGIYAVGSLLLHYYVVRGWTSIMFTLCLIGSFNLIGMGMVGEYVAKVFEEVKGRPLYIVDSTRSRNLEIGGEQAIVTHKGSTVGSCFEK
jgi:glycosyltransferase involved in cell wall biosynthesis